MNWLSNLKLRTQILVVFAALATTAGIVSGLGIYNITRLSDSMNHMAEYSIVQLQQVDQLGTSFQNTRGDLMLMILSRTADEAKNYGEKCRTRNAEVDSIAAILSNTLDGSKKSLIGKFIQESAKLSQYSQTLQTLAVAGNLEDSRTLLFGDVDRVRSAMQEDLTKLSKDLRTDGENEALAGREKASKTILTTIIGASIAVLVVVVLGLFVVRSVTNPLKLVVQSINNADLNTVFGSTRKDEIGDLMQAFDRFVKTIQDTLLRVSEASAAVASASAEISSSTEQMAAGAQQQSAQANDVSAAVEEMTKTIYENSKNANATAETAKTAKQAAEQGGNVVLESVAGMRRIADSVKQSATTVRELGKSSEQIGEIVSVIDDIADQTNLLALNAAIEAARPRVCRCCRRSPKACRTNHKSDQRNRGDDQEDTK